MRSKLLAVVALATALHPTKVEADSSWSVFGGFQCDTPRIRDGGDRFESTCAVAPLAGGGFELAGPWKSRFETSASFARRSFASTALVTDTNVRADYLELALRTALPVYGSDVSWRLRVLVGPQLGILLRARRRFRDVDQDVSDELRSTDIKLVAAVRIERTLGTRAFFAEAGFGWGLVDIDDTNQQEIRSRNLAVRLGITL